MRVSSAQQPMLHRRPRAGHGASATRRIVATG